MKNNSAFLNYSVLYIFLLAQIVIFCSSASALRIPIKDVWCIGYIIFILEVVVLIALYHPRISVQAICVFFVIGFAVIFVIYPYVRNGGIFNSLGTPHPDGWNHIVRGFYLWNNARGADGGLSHVEQYAAHLQNSRWGCSSFMAFLSVAHTKGDPSSVVVIFFILAIIGIYAGTFVMSKQLNVSELQSHVVSILMVCCTWIQDIIYIGNYENLLFLITAPMVVTLCDKIVSGDISKNELFIGGTVSAAGIHGYPEGFAILLGILLPAFVVSCLLAKWKKVIFARTAILITFVLIFVSPIAANHFKFLEKQISQSSNFENQRCGENTFPGLIGQSFLPSFFSFGSEYRDENASPLAFGISTVFFVLMLYGAISIRKRSRFFSMIGIGVAAFVVWQVFFLKYAYGVYKVANIASFYWIVCLYTGSCNLFRKTNNLKIVIVGTGVILFVVFMFVRHTYNFIYPNVERNKFADLEKIAYVTKSNGIVNSVVDPTNYIWSIYFLRNLPIVLDHYLSYPSQKHVLPFMERALRPERSNVAYFLSDCASGNAIWDNGKFRLFRNDEPYIMAVNNPNGIDLFNNQSLIWLNNDIAVMFIFSPDDAVVTLSADEWIMGPSIGQKKVRTVRVKDASGVKNITVVRGDEEITLDLVKGVNEIEISCLDVADIFSLPNGDSRILLLGLVGYKIICE